MSVHQLYLADNKWMRDVLKWLLEGELANDCKPGGADNEREDMEVVDKAQWNYSNSFV